MAIRSRALSLGSLVALLLLNELCLVVLVTADVVEYNWTVRTRRSVPPYSPDCYTDRDLLLINDMNPGPLIRAKVGDMVRVTITNLSPTEALTIHYHGITMLNQPYSDGAAYRSQCYIAPMQTQVNEFVIGEDDVGAHYWHGHTSLDRTDGLQGPIIIEDPNETNTTIFAPPGSNRTATSRSAGGTAGALSYDDERFILLQDWYHRSGPSARIGLDSVPFIWVGNADSFLINGKGMYLACDPANVTSASCDANCTSDFYLSPIDVEAGKTYLFHVMNVAAVVPVNFAIANHTLTVVRADGTLVTPFQVDSLDIGIAQRYSVLVTANQDAARSYWVSAEVRFHPGLPQGYAYLRYNNATPPPTDTDPMPSQPLWDDLAAWIAFESQVKTANTSYYPTSFVLSAVPNRQLTVVGAQAMNSLGQLRWAMNNVTQTFPSSPTVYTAYQSVSKSGALAWPNTESLGLVSVPDQVPTPWNYSVNLADLNLSTSNAMDGDSILRFVKGDVVDLTIQNTVAFYGMSEFQSWHLHGHKFWVVGQGVGNFNPDSDPATYNLDNPVRRDTMSLLPYGWTTIRFAANNPGAWAFRGEVTPHLVMGMGMTVVTSPDLLPPPPPGVFSCVQTSLNISDAPKVCNTSLSFTSAAATTATLPNRVGSVILALFLTTIGNLVLI